MSLIELSNDYEIKNISKSTIWDNVALSFGRHTSSSSVYAPGRDNFDMVWPVLFQIICEHLGYPKTSGYRACDFGCGTGILAEQLSRVNFQTYACDISEKMITQANMSTQGNVVYDVGSQDFVRRYSPFKLITSIMVFQFVRDMEALANTLSQCLDEDGILFFAVHNIEYVNECIKHRIKFREVDKRTNSTVGEILINSTWIETYVRSPEWYDKILLSMGLCRIGSTFKGQSPPLEYLSEEIHPKWHSSKYYIAWYKKIS